MAHFVAAEDGERTHYFDLNNVVHVALKAATPKAVPAKVASATIHLRGAVAVELTGRTADAFMEQMQAHHTLR